MAGDDTMLASRSVRLRLTASLVLCVAACGRGKPPAPNTDPNQLTADAFCKLLFEAPKRQLAARCSTDDQKRDEYARLENLAVRPVAACIAALEPGRAAGRLVLHKGPAEACSRVLEIAPWKTTLRTRDLAAHTECKSGLWTGKQAENAPCRTSLECGENLWCSGATFDSDGACKKRGNSGEKCEAPVLFLFDEVRASCSDGNACDFGPFRPAYALADSVPFSAELEKELGKKARAAEQPKDGDVFGAGGLGLSGIGEGGGRGEGIGLGSIGTFGNSGSGRLGSGSSKSTPRVRMGATTVAGRLPPEVIQRIVRQNFGRFRMCYEKGLEKNPKLEGKVSVRFVIGRDGSVSSSKPTSDLSDKAVVDCVTRAMHGLSFPQPEGGIVTVDYPILFSPGDTPTSSPDAGTTGTSDAGSDAATDAAATEPPPQAPDKSADSPLACVAALASGKPCGAPHHCATGLTCRAGQCQLVGKSGDACESDLECKPDQYCGVSGDHGVCKALGTTGTACTRSSQCRGACIEQKCTAFCGME